MTSTAAPESCVIAPITAQSRATDVHALGQSIAALAARLHAATYELLVMLAEFDARKGWGNGFLSCAHWLHWRTGIDLGASREKVRVARALPSLPLISARMRAGQLSYAKVRALTRVATTDNELALMTVALAGTAAQVERFARAWRRVDEAEFGSDTRARHLRRQLAMWVDDDGMVIIRGRLAPEVGAVVQRAVEAAADRLFREGRVAPTGGSVAEEVTSAQRRADALALLAEAALATDLDAASAGDRYQVVVHVSADAPETGDDVCGRTDPKSFGEETSMVDTDSGLLHVSAETSRRLACDASVVRMVHDPDGGVLDVGRKTRSVPSAIRRALLARDRQCQFPGCTSRRCDAHHVEHWADGGATSLENLVLLCRRHHRAVHEGGFGVVATGQGEWRFSAPNGDLLPTAPPATAVPAGVPLAEWHIPPGTLPAWDGTPLRLAWAIDVTRDRAARQAPQ